MKFKTLHVVLAAALVAAAPAQARVSLADRVTALEAQASTGNAANLQMLDKLNQQQDELRNLRAQVEELQHQLQQMQQRGKDQYIDLDSRLNRLEGGAPALPDVPAGTTGTTDGSVAPTAAVVAPAAAGATAAATAGEAAPSVHGDVGAIAQAGDERSAYNVAFDQLKAGNYADSAQLFTSFLELYPNGVYAPNALYWLGESYYVTQNYQLAGQQFQTLLDRYPTHDKAAGAMLKLGLSEYGLGQVDAAQQTLGQVISQYPGSDIARTADDRLKAIQLGQVR
ncbi:tol-pal system protein YbgF [Pseudoxanthomonas dokdonensis]|uniref:Cell division coordinator CpoB n=1 Tax=Pseudoxanthomonas dokdonensis TaxID=344882 RepID=A0A0R0D1P4_9GAMM|nr:tol-pal system protein YbgF [Pseudoxanthomonas dokdonensis]KRG71491.1 tol-pal system protein YbgF [Pseudoxanthomonas dokdonensis]